MPNRLEIPGEPAIQMPSQTEQLLNAIYQQLGQVTQLLNVLAGQVDLGLRLGSGQMSKHEVKVKFEENDAKVRAAQRAAEAAGPED